jgi:hypothetical protein
MDGRWNDWMGEDDENVAPNRKRKRDRDPAEDLDLDERDEWSRERGSRGRKPEGKKHRRPKPEVDGDY